MEYQIVEQQEEELKENELQELHQKLLLQYEEMLFNYFIDEPTLI
jgi:hypothetical protein